MDDRLGQFLMILLWVVAGITAYSILVFALRSAKDVTSGFVRLKHRIKRLLGS